MSLVIVLDNHRIFGLILMGVSIYLMGYIMGKGSK